jgi:hypothetical protein
MKPFEQAGTAPLMISVIFNRRTSLDSTVVGNFPFDGQGRKEYFFSWLSSRPVLDKSLNLTPNLAEELIKT